MDFLRRLFDTSGFVPRWICGAWSPELGWLHIISDTLIWLAYLAIPIVLVYFIQKRKTDVPFPWMFWMFGAFIVSCGFTHLTEAIIFYEPIYRLSGVVKFITALASWGTVIALIPVVPQALAMKSPRELEREIAERKRVEMQLAEAQAITQIGSWEWDLTSNTMSWSDELYRIFGLSKADFTPTFEDILTHIHPDDHSLVRKAAYDAYKTQASFSYDHRIIRPDGTERILHARGKVVSNKKGEPVQMIGTGQDVTERRKMTEERNRLQKQTAEERDRLRALIESIADEVWFCDKEGQISLANRAAARGLGVEHPEETYQPLSNWLPQLEIYDLNGQPKSQRETPLLRSLEGEVFTDEEEMIRHPRTGEFRYRQVSAAPIRSTSHEILGAVSVVRDITERMHLIEELKRSNTALEEFASVASHDLREPLRKIVIFSDHLEEICGDTLGEEAQDILNRIQNTTGRMQALIDGLLHYSRITIENSLQTQTDLNEIVQDVITDLEVQIQQTNGQVEVDALPIVAGNPTQMHQLLQNLIGNGLKFHRPNTPPRVKVYEQHSTDETAQIVVEDNGIGFSEEDTERIFGIFQRLHGRNSYEGAGIGLAICRKIAEHHGGRIQAESQPGKGAKFIVSLPRYEAGSLKKENAKQYE